TSDGNGDKSSSSVSSSTTNSSSSAKSSSSTGDKNSGGESSPASSSVKSSSSGTSADSSAGNSSSSSKARIPCSEEDEMATLNGVDVICHDGYWIPASSSSAVPTSSYFDMTEQFNKKVSYGEFTDPRDGQKYRTVSLYDDTFERTYVFFAENLNYGKMISGGSVQDDSTKYCYDDDPWYCENGWGGLYTWSHAMNFPTVCDSVSMYAETCAQKFVYPSGYAQPQNYVQHQGICPEGWHIVNAGEWAHLDQRTGGSVAHYMGSKVAGFGSNNYGLSILPAGYWNPVALEYGYISNSALYWLPQQYPEYDDCSYRVSVRTDEFNRTFRGIKTQGFSIRCVKNY
ncbi:FISUMP domain-containing protein, partial [Fibrobacter sp. HC4]|uniref:FISUMP domain-containing protein n=1 Tax=Fibrobacter sp. HC4 TaxID=3239812 RepID=UPI002019B92E